MTKGIKLQKIYKLEIMKDIKDKVRKIKMQKQKLMKDEDEGIAWPSHIYKTKDI